MFRRTLIAATIVALAFVPSTILAQQGATAMPTPTTSGYVPVEGGQVYYATYGEGEPLVLLHGGLMTIESFGPVLELLSESRKVIAVELQGHGRTGPLDREMSYSAMAADVAAVIAALGHGPVDVVGYSMGGGTALRLAIEHPQSVKRLVVASAPFAFSGWHDYNQQGMQAMSSALFEGMKGTPLFEAFAAVNPDSATNFPKLLDQMAYMGRDYDWSAEIPAITAPTLLVYGDWDAVRTAHAARFFELLGGGTQDALWDGSGMNHNRLAILPGITHYTMMQAPELAETALGFFERQ
jgi:pimeloyl-ACP methyl ester carboxylesterase